MSHKYFWFIVLILTILIGSSFSYAYTNNKIEQVILIVINQLSFTDEEIFNTMNGFENLEKYAAKGAMNINSAGSKTDFNSYLTIGGGSRGIGLDEDMGSSYMANEIIEEMQTPASDLYRRQTGANITDNNTIIFLPIENLKKADIQRFSFEIGGLGKALNEAGQDLRIYGNNDTNNQIIRYAPLITMNQNGISYGDVSKKTLIADSSRPYGLKTDYSYLLNRWREDQNTNVSLVVFDLGDLYRLEQFSSNMSIEYEAKIRKEILNEISDFINYFFMNLKDRQALLVVSPMVSSKAISQKELLAPLWIYYKGNKGNILISNTTRRDGIVANIDIAPTILDLLGFPKRSAMVGEKIRTERAKIDLQKELYHITKTYDLRATVLYNYVMLQIIILIIATIYWLRNKKVNSAWVRIALISMLFLPCMLLISAYITPNNSYIYLITVLFLSLILGWSLFRLRPPVSFLIIGFITFLIISIDIILGAPFMQRSFLGYDPMIGARYYGIGNEYMGVYIGSTLLFVGSFLQIQKNKLTLAIVFIVFMVIIFLLSYPTLGTNAGGTIAAIFAIGITSYKILNLTLNRKSLYSFIAVFLLIIISLFLLNLVTPIENQSHVGKAIRQLSEGDFVTILQTIQRKLEMNWRLIQVSLWSKVMITSLASLGILFLWPKYSIKILGEEYQSIYNAFYGILLGAFAALVSNDSGIVAASTMIIYLITPMLYIALLKKTELKS